MHAHLRTIAKCRREGAAAPDRDVPRAGTRLKTHHLATQPTSPYSYRALTVSLRVRCRHHGLRRNRSTVVHQVGHLVREGRARNSAIRRRIERCSGDVLRTPSARTAMPRRGAPASPRLSDHGARVRTHHSTTLPSRDVSSNISALPERLTVNTSLHHVLYRTRAVDALGCPPARSRDLEDVAYGNVARGSASPVSSGAAIRQAQIAWPCASATAAPCLPVILIHLIPDGPDESRTTMPNSRGQPPSRRSP